ncbi:Cryptic asc operon repressor [Raoultella planticola]|uniref:Cryptic asc operon repressor n=1 Tax=Raoultella planticola TaxID=575 RepID=A0A485B4F2_RAOPL|nr:Cryptic asc operon repressor [Raoultella planticola]
MQRHGLFREGMIVEEKTQAAYGDAEMTELGRSLAQKICRQSRCPDGIVAINDALGIGLMAGLHEAGISVPGEISIIGIDNIPLSGLVYPRLSSVMPPLSEMAEVMVQRLIERNGQPVSPAAGISVYPFPGVPSVGTRCARGLTLAPLFCACDGRKTHSPSPTSQ